MRAAVCIGINKYGGVNRLEKCVQDATDWASLLGSVGFNVKLLLDEQATGPGIRRALLELATSAQPGDSLVVTYSGHGSQVPDLHGDEGRDGLDECWCGQEITTSPTTGIVLDDEVGAILAKRQAKTKLAVISDSCHSESMLRLALTASAPPRLRFMHPSAFLPRWQVMRWENARRSRAISCRATDPSQLKTMASAILFSGCADDGVSYEGETNGAFTAVAINAFKHGSPGLSWAEWAKAVRRSLPSDAFPQIPHLTASLCQRYSKALV
jgi:metacaspase-1